MHHIAYSVHVQCSNPTNRVAHEAPSFHVTFTTLNLENIYNIKLLHSAVCTVIYTGLVGQGLMLIHCLQHWSNISTTPAHISCNAEIHRNEVTIKDGDRNHVTQTVIRHAHQSPDDDGTLPSRHKTLKRCWFSAGPTS